MKYTVEKLKEFYKTFDMPYVNEPQFPSKERMELRVKLLQEELDELKEAIENNDFVEVMDAFIDLQYILSGGLLEFGIGDISNDLFDEVHRSNMSKSCISEQEALETIKFYFDKDGTEAYHVESNGKWNVYRKGDDKLLKSINYSKVDFSKFLNK